MRDRHDCSSYLISIGSAREFLPASHAARGHLVGAALAHFCAVALVQLLQVGLAARAPTKSTASQRTGMCISTPFSRASRRRDVTSSRVWSPKRTGSIFQGGKSVGTCGCRTPASCRRVQRRRRSTPCRCLRCTSRSEWTCRRSNLRTPYMYLSTSACTQEDEEMTK